MSEATVIVTEREYAKAERVFAAAKDLRCIAAPADEAELAAMIRSKNAGHAIVGITRYEDLLYQTLPAGAVLARFGVGHDGIDKGKATAAGLFCTNTPGVLDQSVAEHALLLMLAATRRLSEALAAVEGSWTVPGGRELAGKTLAVIGLGPIGRATARIASLGFGMRVIGCVRQMPAEQSGFARITTDFAEAVDDADFVSLHIPAIPATSHFMNRERIALLAPHAWLINTARGSVVDEDALYEALSKEAIGGAALDVFEREPYLPANSERDLRKLSNVLLTPHIGSNTVEANERMAERALRNVRAAESKKWSELDLLNPEVLGHSK